MKIFEAMTVDDNPPIKKTASSTRKTTSARKTTLQQDDQPHLQCGQDEMKKTFVNFDFKFGSCEYVGRKQDIFVTPLNTVPPGYLENTTAVQASRTTKEIQIPSKSPGRQKCLLLSPRMEPQHVVDEEIFASQTEEVPLVTSQGREL